MKSGRRRPPSKPQQQLLAAGNRFYAPPATAPAGTVALPQWLRLGAWVRVDGERLAIVSIRPKSGGGWELMGHKTANRWYDADQVEPL